MAWGGVGLDGMRCHWIGRHKTGWEVMGWHSIA